MQKFGKRVISAFLCVVMLFTSVEIYAAQSEQKQEPWLLSKNRQIYASSENGSGELPIYANDGKLSSRWQAAAGITNQWITVDLGASADVSQVVINWNGKNDSAKDYEILVSDDEIEWTSLYRNRNGKGGEETKKYRVDGTVDFTYYKETVNVEGRGRYVKLYARKSNSSYGVSVRELEVYGVGGLNEPERNLENLALDKPTAASSERETWNTLRESKYAVDGEYNYFWQSLAKDGDEELNNEWWQVDLKKEYTLGKIIMQWGDKFGRMFEIQTSLDGKTWTPVYRETQGIGDDIEFSLYQKARYVRFQGVAMRDDGYSIREFMVYEYQEGDPKQNPELPEYTEREVVQVGKGSYLIDQTLPQPREPKYITSNIKDVVPSSKWYTSVIFKRYSDSIVSLPLVCNYTSAGLGMYHSSKTYTGTESGSMGAESKYKDLIVGTSSIANTPAARLDGYGDWSATVSFSDDETPKMLSTIVKGSPFIYNTFADPSSAQITVSNLEEIYDDDGNQILMAEGDKIVTDHIGLKIKNESKSPENGDNTEQHHFYGVFAPKNTTFIRTQGKIIVQLGNDENYLSVGVMHKASELSYMHEFAYAFVTNTVATYKYNDKTGKIKTTFKNEIDLKRTNEGFRDETLMCLFPHQWKNYNGELTNKTFESIRGKLKVLEGSEFSYELQFNGLIPGFTEPMESDSYDKETLDSYVKIYENSINNYWTADPYWQGKALHTLASVSIISQELGYYDLRNRCVATLKKILSNWLTYSGEEDAPFNMYYHTSWGSMSGDGGDHGMARNLSDHHFLWGYFIYSAAVVASYDKEFVEDYGEMVEMLIRDCMNPDRDDTMFPYMRNFDCYEGHSWAGGYGDNNSGNNQESASEATFAWSGLYLWGLVTEQDKYRDAGIWGFTTEGIADQQYWFNIDGDNWDEDYIHGDIGIVYGLAGSYGTYFSGNPCCIYGIHWLPVTPSLCFYGLNRYGAETIWKNYVNDQQYYQDHLREDQNDPEGWHHIVWPFMSLSDPDGAIEFWNEEEASGNSDLQANEKLTSYWYIQNMCAKGRPTMDVWSNNYTSYEVFEKNGKYSATVWNPFDYEIKVEFSTKDGVVGSTWVSPHDTVSVDPFKNTDNTDVEVPDVEPIDKIHQIPGMVQAEDYYTSFGCSSIADNEVGQKVGYTDANDYLVYDVDVEETADYVVEYRFKSGSSTEIGELKLQSDNDNTKWLSDTKLNDTKSWNVVKDQVRLEQGRQKLKLLIAEAGFDLDWIRFYKVGTDPGSVDNADSTKADLTGAKLLSSGKSAETSSVNGNNVGTNVTDGNYSSRWESKYEDPQWVSIDLGTVQKVGGTKLYWEAAYGKEYTIDISEDGNTWKTVFVMTNGSGGRGYGDDKRSSGLESIKFDSVYNARYVRMYGTARPGGYGYSLYEFEIYGAVPGQKEVLEAPSLTATGKEDTVTLKWNSINGALEYEVYRADSLDGEKHKIATVKEAQYTDNDVPNGTYYYWVKAIPTDKEKYNASTFSEDIRAITVDFIVDVTKIELSKTAVTLKEGETMTLEAVISPAKATDKTITWSTTDRDVVSVRKGVIRGMSAGSAVITATSSNGKSAKCTVEVTPKPTANDDEEATTIQKNEETTTDKGNVTTDKGQEATTKVQGQRITTGNADKTKPKKIKKLKLKSVRVRKVKITWKASKKSEKVTGYQIIYSTNKKFKKNKKIKNISSKKFKKAKNSFTIKKLKMFKRYYVKVRAYKKVNGVKIYGKYSAKKKIVVKK